MTGTSDKWWLMHPKRLLTEYEYVTNLQNEYSQSLKKIEWIELENASLVIRGEIQIDETIKKLDLVYPHFYPSECPTIFPIPRGEKWSMHQFGGDGALCLEFGADNWEPTLFTAADLIYSLLKLLCFEKIVSKKRLSVDAIPSRHKSTLGEELRGKYYRFFGTSNFHSSLEHINGVVKWRVRLIWLEESCIIYPIELPIGTRVDESVPNLLRNKYYYYDGVAIELNSQADKGLLESVSNISEVNLVIEKMSTHKNKIVIGETEGFRIKDYNTFLPVLLFSSKECYRVFVLRDTNGKTEASPAGIIEDGFVHMSARISTETFDLLKKKKIGIVGLGSAGSKIAVSLARSGIANFVLVDDDIMLPGNVVRNELDFTDVGGHKVNQVASAIKKVSKQAILVLHKIGIGSQSNTAIHEKVLADLRTCDVIVDCTANPNCFLILAMACNQSKKPLVWLEVFGGGLGGLVARSDPVREPCPLCVRRALNCQLSKYPPAPHITGEAYELRIRNMQPVVALDADVSFVSSIAVHTVINLLTNNPPTAAILLFGLKQEWIFTNPYQFIPIKVTKNDWNCPECWQQIDEKKTISSLEEEKLKAILKDFKKEEDANTQNRS